MNTSDIEDPQESPSFSIFTPSVLGPIAPTNKNNYTIPPPVPESPETAMSPPATPSESGQRHEARSNLIRKLSQRDRSGNGSIKRNPSARRQDPSSEEPSPTETVASEFRPYRHTMERDRDSILAKFNHEDSFEYEQLLQSKRKEKERHQTEDAQEELQAEHHWPQPAKDYSFPPSPASSRPTSPRIPSRSASPAATSFTSQPMRKYASDTGSGRQSNSQQRHSSTRCACADPRLSKQANKMCRRESSQEMGLSSASAAIHKWQDSSGGTTPRPSPRPGSRSDAEKPPLKVNGHRSGLSNHKNSSSHGSKSSMDRHDGSRSTSSMHRQQASHQRHSRSKLSEDQQSIDQNGPIVLDDSDEDLHMFYEDDDEDSHEPFVPSKPLPSGPPPRDAILAKLESLISAGNSFSMPAAAVTSNINGARSSQGMDVPPRKLLMHAPVLQVVNAHTVKDRYLFLFNDILVIAKPLILEDPATTLIVPPSLDTTFLTKSIVELEKLRLSTQRDEQPPEREEKKKHSLLVSFVDRFANDPKKAIYTLVMKGGLANSPEVIANLLFRTPELNHSQLGSYLSKKDNKHVMKAFIERFRFYGVRLEDSLRCLLATIRLPNDATAAESFLSVFASIWASLNGHSLGWDGALTFKLVMAIMELNDYLHSGIDDEGTTMGHLFGFPNPAITATDFIGAFRSKDHKGLVSDDVLNRIYMSIKKERLHQASDNSITAVAPEIPVDIWPSRLPSRLTYQTMSEEIVVRIPRPDPKFSIKLLGGDVRCEPSVLKFDRSNEARFRITATALGHRTLLFLRCGRNAQFYTGLPINKSFSVERVRSRRVPSQRNPANGGIQAFMKHTFQLSFVNHLGVKRKYMFSMSDANLRADWLQELRSGIDASAASASFHQPTMSRARQVASSVSLQVLRDALIQPDEPKISSATPNRPGSGGKGGSSSTPRQRSNSFSKTYFVGMGRAETDLSQNVKGSVPGSGTSHERHPSTAHMKQTASQIQQQSEEINSERAKTGHDLVLTASQNSHLPAVLGFLSSTVDVSPHPADPNSSWVFLLSLF